jgi:hypothetical protein
MEDDRAEVDVGLAADIEASQPAPSPLKQPKKRFVGRRTAAEAASKSGGTSTAIEDSGAIQGRFISVAPSPCTKGWVTADTPTYASCPT